MVGRSSVGIVSSSVTFPRAFLLSAVERRLTGRPVAVPSRLSVLPWTERGGVRGEARGGRSVGRRTAGMYMGDLGWRKWERLRMSGG